MSLLSWLTGRRAEPEFDPAWESLLTAHFSHWSTLDDDELERMRMLVARFVARTHFEPARGMDLTENDKVLIAAQASMLLLGLDIDEYPQLSSVIVHRSTVHVRGAHQIGSQTWTDGNQLLSGQASADGQVVLSWSAARSGAAHPDRGENVVYHEFAHRLDMLDGITDGTPPLGDDDAVARWVEVCTAAFDRVRDGDSVLRPYAATNPAEFFAVATEMFFNLPVALRDHEAELYDELVAFYHQDPASRTL